MTQRIKFQLYKRLNGEAITSSGGMVYVTTANDAAKATLYDSTGAAKTNAVALTNGSAEFYVANSVASVDLYIMCPGGQFVVEKGVKPGQTPDIFVDTQQIYQVAVAPFSVADQAGDATETDSGIDLPTDALLLAHGISIDVLTIDATETLDVGLLSTESGGDANGLLAAISVATAGKVAGATTMTTGSNETYVASTTRGALLEQISAGTDLATDVGSSLLKTHRIDGTAVSVSWTLTTGSNTAEGFIYIPYLNNLT